MKELANHYTKKHSFLVFWLPLFVFLFVFCKALSANWSNSGYYDYGWAVPFVMLVCLVNRIRDGESETAVGAKVSWWWAVPIVLVIVVMRLFHQVDPVWRLPLWSWFGLFICGAFLLLINRYGVSMALHGLPALVLIGTAVPLPGAIEYSLVSRLTEFVVSYAHDFLLLTGYPVERLGNLFVIDGQYLDVAEACSGIRSFQSCFMIGVVLGEFLRLSISRRLALIGVALLLSLGGNLSRVYYLAYLTSEKGIESANEVHDPIGGIVLFVVFGGASLVGKILSDSRASLNGIQTLSSLNGRLFKEGGNGVLLPLTVIVSCVVIEASPYIWFKELVGAKSPFRLEKPIDAKEISIHGTRAEKLLSYDELISWEDSFDQYPSVSMQVYELLYNEGNGRMWFDVYGHSPDICLPKSGAKIVADPTYSLYGMTPLDNWSVDRFVFSYSEGVDYTYTYKIISLGAKNTNKYLPILGNQGRLNKVMMRKISPERTMFIVNVIGCSSSKMSDSIVEEYLLSKMN